MKLKDKIYKLEVEKLAHSRWWQEDTLVNNRMTWLLQSQILLFAAYGIFSRLGGSQGDNKNDIDIMLQMLPWVGLLICISISIGVHAAWRAQGLLAEEYLIKEIKVGVHKTTNTGGKITGRLMPLVFAGGWGWLYGKGSIIWCLFFFSISLAAVLLIYLVLKAIKYELEDIPKKGSMGNID